MSISALLAVLCVTINDAMAIFYGDSWFTGKSNKSHPRFINLTTGERSNNEAPGFTQVDVDAMNAIADRRQLTPDILEQNPGLLAAFIFSVKMNINVLRMFCDIIMYLRGNDIDIDSLSTNRKVFIAHLAWALTNIGDKPSWANLTFDPLVNAILVKNTNLPLPRFEDASHDDSMYFTAFEKVITTTSDTSISNGVRMDADRFELYLATMR